MSQNQQVRRIVHIDDERCNGCGQCVTACAEGAIRIVNGKARLVSETYCDGLGACLGECPQGAIRIEERLAAAFDAEATKQHLGQVMEPAACACPSPTVPEPGRRASGSPAACPSLTSALANWPVQLRLVPVNAPYFQAAHLLIAADCVPFAFPDFHGRFLAGKTALVGCPKLDDAGFYRQKLADLLAQNAIQSVEVVFMEVPCCTGLARLTIAALKASGQTIPLRLTQIAIRGEILGSQVVPAMPQRG
jgi:Pyruvate/2-oxoacid:ferredoxin oxidoreductase delta subunit